MHYALVYVKYNIMVISYLKQCLLVSLISLTPFNKNVKGGNITEERVYELHLSEVVIKAKKPIRRSEFLGFKLQTNAINTRIHGTLEKALLDYNGPKVPISSLRRHGTVSKHCCGKAVDFAWSQELIDYLVSEEGTAWRVAHGINFYIEDKPGSKKLTPYKNNPTYNKFVFENARASGPHIHLNL